MLKQLPSSSWGRAHAAHLLSRTAFGGSPAEIDTAWKAGLRRAVEALLAVVPDDDLFPVPDSVLDKGVALREAVRKSAKDPEMRDTARKAAQQADRKAMRDLQSWWIQRMRYSPNPLRETMVLFWHGHFASSIDKVKSTHLMWQQNETFRAHALGDFRLLAKEVAHDPAMMRYLDISGSSKRNPNENFARELMELFLLGEGHYTEEDIRESARAFTGYRVNPITLETIFLQRQFDSGQKTFFGKSGNLEPDDIVAVLVATPQCSLFITFPRAATTRTATNPVPMSACSANSMVPSRPSPPR